MRDYLIRRDQAQAARGDVPCSCGHAIREHRELQRTVLRETIDGLMLVPNPDYRPLQFHCHHIGCNCVHNENGR